MLTAQGRDECCILYHGHENSKAYIEFKHCLERETQGLGLKLGFGTATPSESLCCVGRVALCGGTYFRDVVRESGGSGIGPGSWDRS